MPTYTTTYSLGKPVVGADEDAWGDTLNASLDSIDDILDGTTPVTGIDINSGTLDGVTIGGTTAGAGTFTNLTATGTTTLAGASTTADITFGDNDKAIFGAGSDLSIYHNTVGFTGNIIASATNNLYIRSNSLYFQKADGTENNMFAISDGAVSLAYDNNVKLTTTSTGVDITGTLTSDGLTVDGGVSSTIGTFTGAGGLFNLLVSTGDASVINSSIYSIDMIRSGSSNAKIDFGRGTGGADGYLSLSTAGSERLNISSGGDISFYEDTGTTAKFFWDASAESLGIGTSSPSTPLHIVNSSNPIIKLVSDNVSTGAQIQVDGGSSNDSTVALLSSGTYIYGLFRDGSQSNDLRLLSYTDTAGATDILRYGINGSLEFGTNGTERMRIDSSGNLLVGKTSSAVGTAGHELLSYGRAVHTVNASTVQIINRLSNDGDMTIFQKDGTTVGSIGTFDAGYLYIASTRTTDAGIKLGTSHVSPSTTTGADRDNAIDLGRSSARFDDIYATNGTIQTSDQNEKQDIAELTDAEQRVAVAAKGLLRKFRWRDAVEEKGDEARTHFGIIAQDLQAAFAAEGLDAGDYAMFIHTTWTDEETGEEKSRMGVRYSELLAFIIAAI